jgi:RND family efflux transporter MFP subunit
MKKNQVVNQNVFQKFWLWLTSSKKIWISAIAIVLILVIGIWKISSSTSSTVTYQTDTVKKGTVVSTVSASGKVLTTNILSISTQASGVVKKVYVKDGDKVVAGQKLAEITLDSDGTLANAKAYASYLSAQNSVTSANNSYRSSQASLAVTYDQLKGHDTDETLVQKEQRTKAEVSNDNAYDNTRQAAANLVSANYTYRLTSPVITAPFSGTIQSVSLVEGMVLSSSTSTTNVNSQRVAVLKGDSLPVVNVSLSEVDVPRVLVGQKVTVTFDSITDKTFTGIVATIDKVGTVSSNVTSYSANIKLDSGSDQILPNMAVTCDIVIETATDVLYVPSSSLVTQDGVVMAKTLVNGKEVQVPVETGISSDVDTVITSGLTENTTVITGTSTKSATTSASSGTSVFSSGLRGIGGGGR